MTPHLTYVQNMSSVTQHVKELSSETPRYSDMRGRARDLSRYTSRVLVFREGFGGRHREVRNIYRISSGWVGYTVMKLCPFRKHTVNVEMRTHF